MLRFGLRSASVSSISSGYMSMSLETIKSIRSYHTSSPIDFDKLPVIPMKPYSHSLRAQRGTSSSKQDDKDCYVEHILENNRKWVEKTKESDPDFFDKLGKKVFTPKYLYFGCSDARVPANHILGLG